MEKRTEEQRKEFAKEQVDFLKKQGVRDKERISRIFRCAGPGQVREAWAFATSEDWSNPIGRIRKNLLDCLVSSYGGTQEIGWNQTVDILQLCGFYIPKVSSSHAFFKVLDGALEIILPGSYEFDTEEEQSDVPQKENEQETSVQPSQP
jgi:hypothetical protein